MNKTVKCKIGKGGKLIIQSQVTNKREREKKNGREMLKEGRIKSETYARKELELEFKLSLKS